jgi:Sec-independent protein translocase protein TatA
MFGQKTLAEIVKSMRVSDRPIRADASVTREELERRAKEQAAEEAKEAAQKVYNETFAETYEEAYQRVLEELLDEHGYSD